ncbi:MAG TPA: hypothetical protein VJ654_04715 [Noviherbaspirillum sp.]|nr:hypothetical protein [Noviherbaspirillum sp.]
MYPMLTYPRSCRLVISATAVIAASMNCSYAAPANAVPDAAILVHHVHLKGGGFDRTVSDLLEYVTGVCQGMGKDPGRIPTGEKAISTEEDIYYTLGGSTTHIRTRQYSVDPQSCTLKRKEKYEVTMHTSAGVCQIKPDLKRAAGYCEVQPLLTTWTGPAHTNRSVLPTERHMEIAGYKCRIWAGEFNGMNMERCIAGNGRFASAHLDAHSAPGLVLKTATWLSKFPAERTSDYEATAVESDTHVPLGTIAPHITGGYEVIQTGKAR